MSKSYTLSAISVALGVSLVVSLTGTPAMAEDMTEDTCVLLSSLAGTVMRNRQAGVPMAKMLNLANNREATKDMPVEAQDAFIDWQKTTIMEAYAKPSYHSEAAQQREISEFENLNLRGCLTAVESD